MFSSKLSVIVLQNGQILEFYAKNFKFTNAKFCTQSSQNRVGKYALMTFIFGKGLPEVIIHPGESIQFNIPLCLTYSDKLYSVH